MNRRLERELLDDLPANDPRAVASRSDLERLNGLMGHAGIISSAVRCHSKKVRRVVELGAGDGTLMLKIAAQLAASGGNLEFQLVDQQKIVGAKNLEAYTALGWQAENIQADVFEWLDHDRPPVDLMVANLFLHHFTGAQLEHLLARAAKRANLFIACEPRRARFPLVMTKLLWLIGCNHVTRHDAAISVYAGFAGSELSRLWPADGWLKQESAAGLFSHCFVARRNSPAPSS